MPPLTLAAVAAVHLVTAAAFVAVGRRFLRREVARANGLARDAFVAWWWAFAGYLALQGTLDAAAFLGAPSLRWAVAAHVLMGPLLAVAACGLAYHIAFLWSGRSWWAVPLAFYYGAAGATYSLWVLLHRPNAVEADAWGSGLAFALPLEGAVWSALLASFGLPLVLGSLAYLALAAKVRAREARYRIVLVGSSLLLWVTSGYAAQVAGGGLARFVAIAVLGLATAAAVMAAYFPPAPVRRWLARAPGAHAA